MLRSTGLLVGAGAMGGLAGCSSIPFVGGDTSWTNWLPEPGTFRNQDHYQTYYIEPQDIAEYEDELDDGYDLFEDFFSPPGALDVDFDEVEGMVIAPTMRVFMGSFTVEDVVNELEDADFDEDDEYEGYTLFLGPEENFGSRAAAGVSDSTLLYGSASEDGPIDGLETLIDTSNGEEDRYMAESEDFATLVDELGGGHFLYAITHEETEIDDPENGQFEHEVARGARIQFDAETSSRKWVRVFEEADDVDLGDVEDWVDENDGSDEAFDDYDDISVSQSGRAAVVTGTIDTDDVFN
ncbi:hypothetical protein [Haladaptatus sp. CMSO5]|uniref:hypothetical protein n=1 Tax=Haladaptatus sp. CMSO5 TaxID=3120514 RepID=UPI002FCE455B